MLEKKSRDMFNFSSLQQTKIDAGKSILHDHKTLNKCLNLETIFLKLETYFESHFVIKARMPISLHFSQRNPVMRSVKNNNFSLKVHFKHRYEIMKQCDCLWY